MPLSAEVVNPYARRGTFRAVLFDFDGTLSLIREGWPRVMVGMMAGILRDADLVREPDGELWGLIERFVMDLNGHPTPVQMARFADEITARGGKAEAPEVYGRRYLEDLMRVVQQRWDVLESGQARPEEWVVPHAHAILQNLQRRGAALFLASGTDRDAVRHEGRLLNVLTPFGDHVYAPVGGDPAFSKGKVVEMILSTHGIRGDELLGFGDGVVETQEVKRAGGLMVGVASVEHGQTGVEAGKRERLIAAGADIIIADYADADSLLAWLWGEA